MTRIARLLLFAGLSGAITSSTAEACLWVITNEPTPALRMGEARRVIQRATAIIDGEVIRPYSGGQAALVRASHVLRGPEQELFQVGAQDSCDTILVQAGERRRMILVGGPDIYFLRIGYSNARNEDRILRSDRRRVWPFSSGEAR